jgi:hypothetical protein
LGTLFDIFMGDDEEKSGSRLKSIGSLFGLEIEDDKGGDWWSLIFGDDDEDIYDPYQIDDEDIFDFYGDNEADVVKPTDDN